MTKREMKDALADSERKLAEEHTEWEKAGVNPTAVNIPSLMLRIESNVLTLLVKEKLGITTDELQLRFNEEALKVMQNLRQEFEPRLREARMKSILVPGIVPSGKLH